MSESVAIDRESRRLIREALDENLLVEAGAGSGKTQMLAERMAAGVASGAYRVEEMAAVTFTRKAASELRGRFHLALEQELKRTREADAAADPDRIARLRSALSNLERFFAGTIHAFCARLLRERPVESGVAPGFTELDEVEDLELRRRTWREFVADRRAAGDADLMALLEAGVRSGDLDSAFATICNNEDVEFRPGEGVCPDPRPVWEGLQEFWKTLKTHLPASIDPDSTCPVLAVAHSFERRLRVLRRSVDRPAIVASLAEMWDHDLKITQKCWATSTADKKRLATLINPLLADLRTTVVTPYLAQWHQYVYRLAIDLLTRARTRAADERRRLNVLNYGDLLTLTARVLRENADVRGALQRKFRRLLVDEFQDTDPVQAEIMFWLAEDPEASAASGSHQPIDWRTVPLRPGALFIVGDPKQSIYRFRRADIEIYNFVRERFSDPGVGRIVRLTLNFRSAPELCAWANQVFETRFPAEPTQYAPRFAALDPNPGEHASGTVATLTHACHPKLVHAEDARNIAAWIRSEVDAGRRRFSDFLILTRRRRDRLIPYASALEALNVPIEVSGAGAFGDSAEVEGLTLLLRVLADPRDPLRLVAVLRGPLFGISDADLFAFKQAGGWFSLLRDPSAEDLEGPVAAALASLNRYFRWTRLLPAGAALEGILEDSGYLALAATSPGGVDAGDLIHAVDRVRQVVGAGGSLAEAADVLESDREAASDVESLPLEPGRTDVVRLMNLHKAKGLEANVVFLADPLGGFSPRVDVRIERTELQARGWLKIVQRKPGSYANPVIGEPVGWSAHEAAEQPYLAAEDDRLLYVAATRARELLVVSRCAGKPGTTWGALERFLAGARELAVPDDVVAPEVTPLVCGAEVQATATAARERAHARAKQPSWAAASVTAEARHVARMTRSIEASPDDPSRVVIADTPSHRADAGQAWGTLIHGLLEHAMRHRAATRDDLRRLAVWLTVEEPQLRTVMDEALDTVEAVATASFWADAKSAPECYEETPFAVMEDRDGLPTVLRGVIDLVHRTAGGWQMIDYKTGQEGAATLPAKHAGQIAEYERAWRKFVSDEVAASLISSRQPD